MAVPTAETRITSYIGLLLKERYRIVKELGSGGFATVYLAHDEELLSKNVVVKVLHTVKIDPWLLRKFQQEKEALARIDHPGVVAVLDEGQTPGKTPFLVMQFVDGVTLRSLVRPGGMEFPRAAEIFRQVGSALQAAHDKGILHRDLKPENIMLQSSGGEDRVRLIDFGIAGIADSVYGSANQSTRIAGTFRYMPPEQIEGKVSAQSDIYAFGAVAFELLTGRAAVESPMQLITMTPESLERKLREQRADIPEEAVKILVKAFSRDPQERYESARDMGDRLAEALRPTARAAAAGAEAIAYQAPPRPAVDQLEVAHVLFLDMVGYSTLAMEDQREQLKQLQDLVRQTPHFLEAEKRLDLIALPAGDGMALVFFGDPTSAAECALEVARAIRENPALRLRMGLHSGPVYRVNDINKNLNVSGGGINMAQRVMDAGDAGHILVSSATADMLAQLGRWRGWLTDLGEHPVKHGVSVHFYNLSTGEAGNPARPSKWEKPAPEKSGATRRWAMAAVAAVLVAGAGTLVYQQSKKPALPVSAPVTPKLELDYFVTVQKFKNGKPAGQPIRYTREMLFPEGYEIAIGISSPAPGFLYILNDGPLPDGSPSINVLYPAPGAAAQIGAGQAVRIPQTHWIVLDQATGTEKLYLAWSGQPVAEFERAKNQTDALIQGNVVIRAPQQLAELRQVLEKYRVPDAQIRKNEDAQETVLTAGKEVLVHLIRLEHQ